MAANLGPPISTGVAPKAERSAGAELLCPLRPGEPSRRTSYPQR